MKLRSERIHVVNGYLATLLGHTELDTAASSKRREGSDLQRAEAGSMASSCDSTSMASTTVVERLWSEADDTEQTLGSLELRRQCLLIAIVQEFLVRLVSDSEGEISQAEMHQLQMDVSFLKHYLLSHQMVTSGEHQLNSAVESFVSGALNRCAQPTLLEPATVKKICDTALSK